MKKPKVWLARNAGGTDWRTVCYVIAVGVRPRYDKGTATWFAFHRNGLSIHKTLTPFDFERLASKSCHLKPGEGPIEVSIDIKRKKK